MKPEIEIDTTLDTDNSDNIKAFLEKTKPKRDDGIKLLITEPEKETEIEEEKESDGEKKTINFN